MHAAALRELGLPWRYLRLPLPPALFAETVRALPGVGYLGINATVPHKRAALALADRASPAARAIGAANTLTFGDAGIEADNTDARGLIAALGEPLAGRRALVLGAGGAGRAAAWALREAGARVAVWNRTAQRGRELAEQLGVDWVERPGSTELLVNTTSVGLDAAIGRDEALDALGLKGREPPATVVDLVYGTEPTPVVSWAHAGGARVVDGLEVLVRQGALSLELWSGRPAPVEVMRTAARTSSA